MYLSIMNKFIKQYITKPYSFIAIHFIHTILQGMYVFQINTSLKRFHKPSQKFKISADITLMVSV